MKLPQIAATFLLVLEALFALVKNPRDNYLGLFSLFKTFSKLLLHFFFSVSQGTPVSHQLDM